MANCKTYYHDMNIDGNKITNFILNPVTTVVRNNIGLTLGPADEGFVVWDTDLNTQFFWDGFQWVAVTASSGTSGTSGTSGATGSSGSAGSSGTSGTSGATGSSGSAGSSGTSGVDGTSGTNGTSGSSGTTGTSGTSGKDGKISTCFKYQAKTTITSGDPGLGHIIWNNATQTSATQINISHIDKDSVDIDIFLALLAPGQQILIQDQNNSGSYQTWLISGPPVNVPPTYWTIPVTLVNSAGLGTTGFPNNHDVIFCVVTVLNGTSGSSGTSGSGGTSGTSSTGGTSGTSGLTNGTSGTSGVDGLTCYKWTVTVTWLNPPDPGVCDIGINYISCTPVSEVTLPITPEVSGVYTFCGLSIASVSYNTDCYEVTINNDGVCSGTVGSSGTSGTSGSGGSSCGDVIKIAAHSGVFVSDSPVSPNINAIYSGNGKYGWSDVDYNKGPQVDGFGNMLSLEFYRGNHLIPLPADLTLNDVIKICGNAVTDTFIGVFEIPNNTVFNFYITASVVACSEFQSPNAAGNFNLTTLITPTAFPFTFIPFENGYIANVCFSISKTLTSTLPGCTKFLLIGINTGSDWEGSGNPYPTSIETRFTFTADAIKYCPVGGLNLLIRNCCEPIYTEVILNPGGIETGKSFVDADGNCWTIVSTTTDNVTSARTITDVYFDCDQCIANNPCPSNYVVTSCCYPSVQYFAAQIGGLNIGDSFVDNNGFCWEVTDTTALPTTYTITAVTVYPAPDACSVCKTANECPQLVVLESCCGLGGGWSTLALIGGGTAIGDTFVDQFGFCWRINELSKIPEGIYPNLSFITAVSTFSDCEFCVSENPCPTTVYYSLKNCCDEVIYIAQLPASYSIDQTLSIIASEMAGCFRVVGWSDTGTPTLTNVTVYAVYPVKLGPDQQKICEDCITVDLYPCFTTCCTSYEVLAGDIGITGYNCDGTYIYNQLYTPGTFLCLSWVDPRTPAEALIKRGLCCFQVKNPSLVNSLELQVRGCAYGEEWNTLLLDPDISSDCLSCVERNLNEIWEYVTPNPCPPPVP